MSAPPFPLPQPQPPWAQAGLELWLIRHGETVWSSESRLAGWTDVALSEVGRLQAAALRQELMEAQPGQAWSSDLRRCRETARLAGTRPTIDERLRELDFGLLEGLSWDELSADAQQSLLEFDGFAAPDGETMERFRIRVHDFLSQLPKGRHFLFTHGGVIRLICRELDTDRLVAPGTITKITLRP